MTTDEKFKAFGSAAFEIICRKRKTGSVDLVVDFWVSEGVPVPLREFVFCEHPRLRFDFCWLIEGRLAVELCSDKFIKAKLNEAAILGWRILFCQPSDLLTVKLTQTIKRALKL